MVAISQRVVEVAVNLLVRMAVTNQRVRTVVIIAVVGLVLLAAYRVMDVIKITTIICIVMVFIAIKLVRMAAINQHVVTVVINLLVRMAVVNQLVAIATPLAELKFVYYVVNHHDN